MTTVFSTAVVEIPTTTTTLNVEYEETVIVELGVIGPLVLHKFELPLNIGIEANELQASLFAIVHAANQFPGVKGGLQRRAKIASPTKDPVAVGDAHGTGGVVVGHGIAGIGAADVGAQGAAEAVGVFFCIQKIVLGLGIFRLGIR